MVGCHRMCKVPCMQEAVLAACRCLQHRHILICHFIENLHIATDCLGKPYHTEVLWLKELQEAQTLLTTHFSRLLLPLMFCFPCGACWKPPNNNKTTTTAGVGRVQLNFLTAGRDSTLEIYLLLLHTPGLNNSAMRAAWRSCPLPLSGSCSLWDLLSLSGKLPSSSSSPAHGGFSKIFWHF